MSTRKESSTIARMIRPVVWGVGVGAVVCTALLMIAAAIMTAVTVPSSAVTPIAMVIAALAACVGGWVTARISRERGLLFGAVCGLVLFLLITAIGLSAFQEIGGSALLIKAALMIGCGALGGVLGVNTKRK